MKNLIVYGLVLSVAVVSASASAAVDIDREYFDQVSSKGSASLSVALAGHLAGVAAACTVSAVPLIVSFIGDSVPVIDVFTTYGLKNQDPEFNSGTDGEKVAAVAGGILTSVAETVVILPYKHLKGEKDAKYRYARFTYSATTETAKMFYGESSRCRTEVAKALIIKSILHQRLTNGQ